MSTPQASDRGAIAIESYTDHYRNCVLRLWNRNFPAMPSAAKEADIDAAVQRSRDLFVVALADTELAGTCVAAFDGLRGWLYYACTAEGLRRRGIGTMMVRAAESRLAAAGCRRVGLQMHAADRYLREFYASLGYAQENTVTYCRRLES